VLVRYPSAGETEIPKFPHQDNVHNFFRLSRIRARWKNSKWEFLKGAMYSLLKRIQRVRSAAFCARDLFLLHDNAPAHKAASVCQFLNQKKTYNLLSALTLSRFISARSFSVEVESEVGNTPLCGCYWDPEALIFELKKVQKEEFSAAFRKLNDRP